MLLAERGGDPAVSPDEQIPLCRRVHDALGLDVPSGKSVIGERVYRHESGMHTAAMLREPSTYEPFDPSQYGEARELLFGEDTGRGAIEALLTDEDIEPDPQTISNVLTEGTEIAEKWGRPLSENEARHVVRER